MRLRLAKKHEFFKITHRKKVMKKYENKPLIDR